MSQFPSTNTTDPTFASDMAAALRAQAVSLRALPDAGFETIRYKVRRGGIAGFFGASKTVTERRLKPGAQQVLDNANILERQAAYYDSLSQSLASLGDRQAALEAQATAQEQAALQIQKPVGEGGSQYTRNDLTKVVAPTVNADGLTINPGVTLGGLRIPLGS